MNQSNTQPICTRLQPLHSIDTWLRGRKMQSEVRVQQARCWRCQVACNDTHQMPQSFLRSGNVIEFVCLTINPQPDQRPRNTRLCWFEQYLDRERLQAPEIRRKYKMAQFFLDVSSMLFSHRIVRQSDIHQVSICHTSLQHTYHWRLEQEPGQRWILRAHTRHGGELWITLAETDV